MRPVSSYKRLISHCLSEKKNILISHQNGMKKKKKCYGIYYKRGKYGINIDVNSRKEVHAMCMDSPLIGNIYLEGL